MGILPSDRLLDIGTIKILRKDKKNINEKLYYTAAEIAQMIGVGRTTAYGIVKQMNEELKSRGLLAVRGKVPKNSLMQSISEEPEVRR